jgi:hypothetical protein
VKGETLSFEFESRAEMDEAYAEWVRITETLNRKGSGDDVKKNRF